MLEEDPLKAREITRLLRDVSSGDRDAEAKLYEIVYEQMARSARRLLAREAPGRTLQTHDLVHEAYLRIVEDPSMEWRDRRYFFAAVGRAMRRILVDQARKRQSIKRGGEHRRVELESGFEIACSNPIEVLAMNEAITRLEQQDSRAGHIVHLYFFANLSLSETANALGTSERTVSRDWEFAKAYLMKDLAYKEQRG